MSDNLLGTLSSYVVNARKNRDITCNVTISFMQRILAKMQADEETVEMLRNHIDRLREHIDIIGKNK